ncbi:MAG: hypothetical protein WC755_09640, partial [Candidatus Woesearchaeota archaeon]
RAGIVEKPEDYFYSSYRYYVNGDNNPLITEDLLFESLGQNIKERQKTYQEMVIDDIILDSYKKKTWGSAEERYNERKKIRNHLK